jgi:hypothetical protein
MLPKLEPVLVAHRQATSPLFAPEIISVAPYPDHRAQTLPVASVPELGQARRGRLGYFFSDSRYSPISRGQGAMSHAFTKH